MARIRLDKRMVDLALAPSRTQAAELVDRGVVLVNGSLADKAARQVNLGDQIVVQDEGHRYVSRGAYKLIKALDTFGISVHGRCALDAGSSTGGFTEVLLERGAKGVVCVDVGTHQLHERIRDDARVIVREETNVRDVDRDLVVTWLEGRGVLDLVVGDLSFTSLEPLMRGLLELAGPHGDLIVLAKPQFEVGKAIASKGRGVLRSRQDRLAGLLRATDSVTAQNAGIMGVVASPIRGTSGNAEFLIWAKPFETQTGDVAAMVNAALDEIEVDDA